MRTLAHDWYRGEIPGNVMLDDEAYLETTYSFLLYRSQADVGVRFERGAHTYRGTMLDVGPAGRVRLGRYALVAGAHIICDELVEIGDHAMVSWNVVLMDSYRVPRGPVERRDLLLRLPGASPRVLPPDGQARPVIVEPNVWIGFESCVLPGVTIGRGSVVGARSVVADDVAPYTVVAGNPARPVRTLETP
jgi:acetyltransferase-like isoleucine patch superfamily enzyme